MRISFPQSAGVVALGIVLLTSAAACTGQPQAIPSPSATSPSPSPSPSATSTVPISGFAGDWYTSNGFNAFPQSAPNGNVAQGAVTEVEVIETGKAPYLSQGEALSLTLSKDLSTLTTAGPGGSHVTVWSPETVR